MATSLNSKYEPIDRHRAVVEHGSGLLVVSAGPGTGKTYALLKKLESLIESGVHPNQIYYLTFVNSIVDAFRADIRRPKENDGLGVDADDLGVRVSTLHSLAFKIVKVYADDLGLSAHLEVIDLSPKPQDLLSRIFVGDLYEYSRSTGLAANKKNFDALLRRLTEAWRRNVLPATDCEPLQRAVALICKIYLVCSWDQLVLLAIKALLEHGLPTWLQGAQHFLIDEYQDFNPAEQHLLELITEPSDSVVIVGDPDQSIYGGRSASPQGLANLLIRDDVECVNFVYCWRCPKKVVTAANNMLKYMDAGGYADKELHPIKDEDGDFAIIQFKSCKAEVEHIARILLDLDASDKADIVVLLPERKVANYYATRLRESGLDCKVKTADMGLDLLIVTLRLVLSHRQPFLQRALLSHIPNLERKYKNQVLAVFLSVNDSLADTLSQASADQNWRKPLRESLSLFVNSFRRLVSGDADSILAGLTDLNLEVTKDVIVCLLASDEDLSPGERVELSLRTAEQQSEESTDDATSIPVLTMHSSKGLSKQLVIIPAFDETLLPGDNKRERLAEMHRLMYVAITRAKGQVLITFPRTRGRGDYVIRGAKPKLSSYAKILVPPLGR